MTRPVQIMKEKDVDKKRSHDDDNACKSRAIRTPMSYLSFAYDRLHAKREKREREKKTEGKKCLMSGRTGGQNETKRKSAQILRARNGIITESRCNVPSNGRSECDRLLVIRHACFAPTIICVRKS